jgi:hypothetical protein
LLKDDYKDREYLSSIEVAKYLDIRVRQLHQLVNSKEIPCIISASGQMRFDLKEIKKYENKISPKKKIKVQFRRLMN